MIMDILIGVNEIDFILMKLLCFYFMWRLSYFPLFCIPDLWSFVFQISSSIQFILHGPRSWVIFIVLLVDTAWCQKWVKLHDFQCIFPQLKSFWGKSLEKYNFHSFNIDKVIENQYFNVAMKVVIFYLCLSKEHFI